MMACSRNLTKQGWVHIWGWGGGKNKWQSMNVNPFLQNKLGWIISPSLFVVGKIPWSYHTLQWLLAFGWDFKYWLLGVRFPILAFWWDFQYWLLGWDFQYWLLGWDFQYWLLGEISNIGFWGEISNIGFWVRFQILAFGWVFQILAFGFQMMIIS